MNDLCLNKRNITFKLRTGDICEDCQKIIHEKEIDIFLVQQVFRIFNGIRSEMQYMQRFKSNLSPGRLMVKGYNRKILFPDFDYRELNLNPLEKTIYLLYLKHPKGIRFSNFPLYFDEIYEIYNQVSSAGSLPQIKNNVINLIQNEDGGISQKISRVNRKIIDLLGEDLARFYKIDGPKAEPRQILLDRNMVIWDIEEEIF